MIHAMQDVEPSAATKAASEFREPSGFVHRPAPQIQWPLGRLCARRRYRHHQLRAGSAHPSSRACRRSQPQLPAPLRCPENLSLGRTPFSTVAGSKRKTASITIRLSKAELAQLHRTRRRRRTQRLGLLALLHLRGGKASRASEASTFANARTSKSRIPTSPVDSRINRLASSLFSALVASESRLSHLNSASRFTPLPAPGTSDIRVSGRFSTTG